MNRYHSLFILFLLPTCIWSQEHAEFGGVDFIVNGGSGIGNDGYLLLTKPGSTGTAGTSVWTASMSDVSKGFTATFKFQIGIPDQNPGGAGFAFAIQGISSTAVGNGASGIGYDGLQDCLVVEFDTFQDKAMSDPNNNHVSVHSLGRGQVTANEVAPNLLTNGLIDKLCTGATPQRPCLPNFRDGNAHEAVINYVPSSDPFKSQLEIYVDYLVEPAARVIVDLPTLLDLEGGRAYMGFTSAIGPSGWEQNAILSLTVTYGTTLGVASLSIATIVLIVAGVISLGACIGFVVYRVRKLMVLGKGYQPLMTQEDEGDDKGEAERVAARLFLRGSRDYSPQEVLVEVGHRNAKPCMLVKHDPSGEMRIMTAITLNNAIRPLLSSKEQQQIFIKIITRTIHPYIESASDVHFSADGNMVFIFRPFRTDGSIRDYLHRAKPRTAFRSKYRARAEPLQGERIAVFGKMILEAMISLRSSLFPFPLLHVSTSNVLLHNKHARISDFENHLLGFKPFQHKEIQSQIRKLEQRFGTSTGSSEQIADAVAFGRLLYEMSTGLVMQGVNVNDLGPIKAHPEAMRILQAIFSPPQGVVPTLQQLASLPFFETAKVPALPQPLPDATSLFDDMPQAIGLMNNMKEALEAAANKKSTVTPGSFGASLRLESKTKSKQKPTSHADDDFEL